MFRLRCGPRRRGGGLLLQGSNSILTLTTNFDNRAGTYVFPLNLLPTQSFHSIKNLGRRHDSVVRKDHFVLRPGVNNDLGDVLPDVPQISECAGRLAVADQLVVGRGHGIVDFAGWEARSCDLVPPANVDDGVGEFELFDVVVYFFFLRAC